MRVRLGSARLLIISSIPFSLAAGQTTPSPAVSATIAVSPTEPASLSPAEVTSAPPAAATSASPTAVSKKKLLYKPPADAGNIPTRVSGGARGGDQADVLLIALVPDHVALTTQAQPSLFWFQSKPAKAKFELTIVEPKKAAALLSLTSPGADKPGIHRVKLARNKVELQPGVKYEWSVAIVPDPEHRSQDIVARGVIKRIPPPSDLTRRVENAGDIERAAAYAEAGIWYDAFESISNAIEAHPNDASLREQRASLLKQVGLSEAAALDKKR